MNAPHDEIPDVDLDELKDLWPNVEKAMDRLEREEEDQAEANKPTIIWEPLPGSQTLALACPCDEVLMDGTRGGGKTECQLMDFKKMVGRGYGKFYRGIIFDREFPNLADVIAKALRWFPQFSDGAVFLRGAELKWVWPTGEELFFPGCQTGGRLLEIPRA